MTLARRSFLLALLGALVRLYLGGVFVFAAFHKLLEPAAFAVDIATYGILPVVLVNPMALVLPWVELLAGVLLAIGWRTRAAALLMAAMLTMFTVAVALALGKGLNVSCGCFASQGVDEDPISLMTVFRDLGWLALTLGVLFWDPGFWGVDRWLCSRRKSEAES